jgi:hypothetical protein
MNSRQKKKLLHVVRKLPAIERLADTTHTAPPAQPVPPPKTSRWKMFGIGELSILLGIPASLIGLYTLRTAVAVSPATDSVPGPAPYNSLFIATNNGLLSLDGVNANCFPIKLVYANGDSLVAPRMLKTTSDPIRSKLGSGEQFTFLCGRIAFLFETPTEHVFVLGDPSSSDCKVLRTKFDPATHQPVLVHGKISGATNTRGPFEERFTARQIPVFQADLRIDIKERPPLIWFDSTKSFRFITRTTAEHSLKWFPAALADPPIPRHGAGLELVLSSDPKDPGFYKP